MLSGFKKMQRWLCVDDDTMCMQGSTLWLTEKKTVLMLPILSAVFFP
jgi:hypothetical protein